MKYEIEYTGSVDTDGAIIIPIKQVVTSGDCISDSFGIDKDSNSLFIASHFSLSEMEFGSEENTEIEEFLKDNFKDPHSVKGFMRRMVINFLS